MKKIDLIGKRFGRLLVLKQGAHSTCGRFLRWECQCDCGRQTLVQGGSLKSGNTKSCGCLLAEGGKAQKTHGEGSKETKEYRAWLHMKNRCYLPSTHNYANYGGRGICVCDRWLQSYETFLKDMGRAPSPKHSLDRIDTNGNYEPKNCRWATSREQMNNVRYNKIIYLPDGTQCTLAEMSRRTGIKYTTLLQRIQKRWPYDRLISPP